MRALQRLVEYFCPGILVTFPKGMTPDISSDWGQFALMQTANNYSQNPITILSNATSNVLTATQVVGNGLLLRTGAPGGAVSDQLPTAVAMIGIMKGPVNIPLDGTYSEPLRILNFTGQTITLTTNTGLTLSGTMTIADGTFRDFMLTPTTATAITVQNVGAGVADSSAVFTNLIVTGNLTVGGNTTMGGTLSVTGNTSLSSATLSGTLGVAGATTLTSLTASGAVTFSALTANSFLFSGVGGLLTTTAAPTNGQLLIGSTGAAPAAAALTGTANQITVTNGAGTITLSAPQDIAPGSSPTFTAITLSGLTASSFIYSGATKQITSTAAPTNGQLLIGSTGAVPVAAALTGTANQVIVTNGAGTITLSVPQDIATTSTVRFGAIGIGTTAANVLDIKTGTDTKIIAQDGNTAGNARFSTVNLAGNAFREFEINTLATHFFTNGAERQTILSNGHVLIGATTDTAGAETLQVTGNLSISSATLLRTYTAFTNNAGASLGTLTNAPAVGNPTKWIPINDNGTIRNIPAW